MRRIPTNRDLTVILGGFDQLENLTNLSVLDISRCMLDTSLEEFEKQILAELKKLTKLEYLCVGDNPISTRFPELKYITIHELTQLQYFDYASISNEQRQSAELVRQGGMEALRRSSRINKEDKRLKAEQREFSKANTKRSIGDKTKVKIDEDATKALSEATLQHIFMFLPTDTVATCRQVCRRWHQPAAETFVSRCVRVLKNMNIIVASDHYRPIYEPYMKQIRNNSYLASIESRITPINNCDEVSEFCMFIVRVC